MKRTCYAFALMAFTLSMGTMFGCTPLAVRAIHEPFHPSSTQQITLSAEAESTRGIAEISIVQRTLTRDRYCAPYVAGECLPLPTIKETTVQTCQIEPPSSPASCRALVGPFQDGSFVTYGARAKDATGMVAGDQWIGFGVGAQADPSEPIAVYVRSDAAKAVDVVMVPVDYNGTPGRGPADFASDARRLIVDGYLAHAQITGNRSKWNFYLNPATGGLVRSNISGTEQRSITQPANWTRIAATANAAAYVHHDATWRDFGNFGGANGVGQLTIQAGTPGTIVHETGHAVFGLSDEYCCDGGIISTSWPHENMFTSLAACQASATAHGLPTASCTQLTTTNGFCGGADASGTPILGSTDLKWRQDTASDLMGCGGNNGAAGGILDSERIQWYYNTL
ncbi:hypothetical protein [Variovorax ginsengisoli]|uniref:Uncharacterized protein n=1 Tax=Variovorax ginsengisoli TaxID=363844 RepID=A0ABT8SA53_9BURK|nr:hypothetical protein [Variovorax ginsengisoli]MDN8616480.1 hypothetical protein [Variovorax ginsengisoli]MDO1535650.1 hypothetical protein [Variovorax ginsengisoli]